MDLGHSLRADALSACPNGDLDSFEGVVAGVSGSDLEGPFSGEWGEIYGGFEVTPGVPPVVAPYGPACEDFAARAGEGDGVRGLGVAGVAAYGEGVGDLGSRTRFDEDRIDAPRG